MPNKNDIAFIDDHSILLQGLKGILSKSLYFQSFAFFSTPSDLLSYLQEDWVGLVVTDLSMPRMDGFYIIQKIKSLYPTSKVAVYTQNDGKDYFADAINAGADAYILKTEDSSHLPDIFKSIIEGERFISKEMVKHLENLSPSSSLNAMEKEILLLIKEGNTMKDISEKLNITTKVIEYRLRKIRLIYSAKNNTELIGKLTQVLV